MTQTEIDRLSVGDLIKLSPQGIGFAQYFECDINHIYYYVKQVHENSILTVGNVNGVKREFVLRKVDLKNDAYTKGFPQHHIVSTKKQVIKEIYKRYDLHKYLNKIVRVHHYYKKDSINDFAHRSNCIADVNEFRFKFLNNIKGEKVLICDTIDYNGKTYYFDTIIKSTSAFVNDEYDSIYKLIRWGYTFTVRLRMNGNIDIICSKGNCDNNDNDVNKENREKLQNALFSMFSDSVINLCRAFHLF